MNRRCPKCGQFKPVTDFGVRRGRKGHPPTSYCRRCDSRAGNESCQRRKGIPEIRAAIQAALQQHGPLTTVDLAVAVKTKIGDAYPVNPGIIARHGIFLKSTGQVTDVRKARRGSIWALTGETRPYAKPVSAGKRVYQTKIGLDEEHLAWMAQCRAAAEARAMRGLV